MTQYTKQEKTNHKMFILNWILFACSIIAFELGSIEGWFIPFTAGVIGIFISFTYMFLVGYYQGWELKRISLEQHKTLKDIKEMEEFNNKILN